MLRWFERTQQAFQRGTTGDRPDWTQSHIPRKIPDFVAPAMNMQARQSMGPSWVHQAQERLFRTKEPTWVSGAREKFKQETQPQTRQPEWVQQTGQAFENKVRPTWVMEVDKALGLR